MPTEKFDAALRRQPGAVIIDLSGEINAAAESGLDAEALDVNIKSPRAGACLICPDSLEQKVAVETAVRILNEKSQEIGFFARQPNSIKGEVQSAGCERWLGHVPRKY